MPDEITITVDGTRVEDQALIEAVRERLADRRPQGAIRQVNTDLVRLAQASDPNEDTEGRLREQRTAAGLEESMAGREIRDAVDTVAEADGLDEAGRHQLLGAVIEQEIAVRESGGSGGDQLAEIVEDGPSDLSEAIGDDGSAQVRIIAPGWGSTGYYDPDVLRRDIPEVFPEGTHMYLDHPSMSEEEDRPERSVRDLAGVTTSMPTWQEHGPHGPGMYAAARVFSPFRDHLDEISPHIGVSIRGRGEVEHGTAPDGQEGPIVRSIRHGDSVDFVTRAGAGGAISEALRRIEESRRHNDPPPNGGGEGGNDMPELAEVQRERDDAVRERDEAVTERDQARSDLDEARRENDRLRERVLTHDARGFVGDLFAYDDRLTERAQRRVIESAVRDIPTTEDDELDRDGLAERVDELYREEVDYLAEVTGSGRIRDMGGRPADGSDDGDLDETMDRTGENLQRLGVPEGVAKAGRSAGLGS